jgi:hypothetical protein
MPDRPTLARLRQELPWQVGVPQLEIGPGWARLVSDLARELGDIAPGYVVIQVKEKFGGLRFYAIQPPESGERSLARFQQAIRDAEDRAEVTCDECGDEGNMVLSDHWYRVRCVRHRMTQ